MRCWTLLLRFCLYRTARPKRGYLRVHPDIKHSFLLSYINPPTGKTASRIPKDLNMFILCDNEKSVKEAVRSLDQASCVFLDCEGRDLGTRDGALSIVSLGSPLTDTVYLIDVVSLSPDLNQLIFDLLENNDLRKVVWDGRMDFAELFFGHSTAIDANVLDLQLVDITSRSSRGESEYKRKQRMCTGFPWRETRKLLLEGMHALNSLDRALREHGVTNAAQKDANVKKAHKSNSSGIWMERPLTSELLTYAAGDIERIAALYSHFNEMGYLEDAHLADLLSRSARYVGLFRFIGRPNSENRFWRSALLPLGILQGADEQLRVCDGCRRGLPEDCFSTSTHDHHEDQIEGKSQSRLPNCRVCCFIFAKHEYKLRKTIATGG